MLVGTYAGTIREALVALKARLHAICPVFFTGAPAVVKSKCAEAAQALSAELYAISHKRSFQAWLDAEPGHGGLANLRAMAQLLATNPPTVFEAPGAAVEAVSKLMEQLSGDSGLS